MYQDSLPPQLEDLECPGNIPYLSAPLSSIPRVHATPDTMQFKSTVVSHDSKGASEFHFDNVTLTLRKLGAKSSLDAVEGAVFRLPEFLCYNTMPYSESAKGQHAAWVHRDDSVYKEIIRSIADDCFLYLYRGVLYNVPADTTPSSPYYCVTHGRFIGVFNNW
jgi:hypothetical protein